MTDDQAKNRRCAELPVRNYLVYYQIDGNNYCLGITRDNFSLDKFSGGFWIDPDGRWPATIVGSSTWVPPHKILKIEAVENDARIAVGELG